MLGYVCVHYISPIIRHVSYKCNGLLFLFLAFCAKTFSCLSNNPGNPKNKTIACKAIIHGLQMNCFTNTVATKKKKKKEAVIQCEN